MAEVGRPTVMTQETVNKLEEVFAIGGTDEEACFYANISRQTLYDYQSKHPEYIDRKEQLKQKPFLKARQTIVKSLETPQYAFEYMKRKKKDEFSERQEYTGKDGEPIAKSPMFEDKVIMDKVNELEIIIKDKLYAKTNKESN